MEGFMDVIAAYRAGIENAVASMGTALSREHVEHLKRLTKKLVLVYDGDKAGQAATLKALDEIGDMPVQIVSMPDNLDPDEYLQKKWSRRLGLSINKKLVLVRLSSTFISTNLKTVKICRLRLSLLKK